MLVGLLKEIKPQESRVALTPEGVEELVADGHRVVVESSAGSSVGYEDTAYRESGAEIARDNRSVFEQCELLLHVKEPQQSEFSLFTRKHTLFTFLHLAAEPVVTRALISAGCTAFGYETVEEKNGHLPLLSPMSEIAGKVAVHNGAKLLEMPQGGSGVLLGGVPGVLPGVVVVLGAGSAGYNAAVVAAGMGAQVFLFDRDADRLRKLQQVLPANVSTVISGRAPLRTLLSLADLVIGAVLVPGAKAPKLLYREDLKLLRPGSVVVDISIDQGGAFETSRPTTHETPVYIEEGVVHYCVTNIPGAVALTSTVALTNATLPYIRELAASGWRGAVKNNSALRKGLNIAEGKLVSGPVAVALGLSADSLDI